MEIFQIVINKTLEILSIRISFGKLSFTLFQLQLFFIAMALLGYFIYGVFDDD